MCKIKCCKSMDDDKPDDTEPDDTEPYDAKLPERYLERKRKGPMLEHQIAISPAICI